MGSWTLQYDSLNRLISGSATRGAYATPNPTPNLCWSYDRGPRRQVFVALKSSLKQDVQGCLTLEKIVFQNG